MRKGWYLLPVVLLAVVLVACGASSGSTDSANQSSGGSAAISTAEDCGSQYILSTEAEKHIGEEGTVCGRIVDYIYKTGESGRPTLLLYDQGALIERRSSISDQKLPSTFEVVVWKEDAKNFPANFGSTYAGNTVCAAGTIETHNNNPAIIVRTPDQLQIDC